MEADKENIIKTRIPLPMHPLPAIPKRLLTESKTENTENVTFRRPLTTLNSQTFAEAGPSKGKPRKPSPMIDNKYVTIRKRRKNVDWSYKVLQDKSNKDESIISVSDDDSIPDGIERNYVEDETNNSVETINAVTPHLKAQLEPNRVRNIKRSLKRPHSRELQGLSPCHAAHQQRVEEKAKRRLLFKQQYDSEPKLLSSPDYWKVLYIKCLERDYTSDVFNYLLENESKPLNIPRTSGITRACVINWLMKVNGINGNPATIQAACWYLDSVLGTGHVQVDKLQLVATACYWVAQKIHGPVAPALRLIKCADRAFSIDDLMAAEKAVLVRLQFPRQPIVPQDYISYLSSWSDKVQSEEIETAATFLCMSGLMMDKILCDEYPSVIAAAAVRNALLLLGRKDLMMRLESSSVYKKATEKAANLSFTCSILRRAVRSVSAPNCDYKAPLQHYGAPPKYVAQKIISAANEMSLVDVRNTERSNVSFRF